jgi:hypothetical protein
MKKIISRSIYLAIFAIIIYTVAWVISATIIKNKIISEIDQLKKDTIILTYDNGLNLGGYPFKISLEFLNPKIEFNGKKHLQLSTDKFHLNTNLIANCIELKFENEVSFESPEVNNKINYNNGAKIEVNFLGSLLLNPVATNLKELWEKTKLIKYNDDGFKIIDSETKLTTLEIENNFLNIHHSINDNKQSKIKIISASKGQQSKDLDLTLGKTNSSSDIEVLTAYDSITKESKLKEFNLTINNLNIEAEKSSIAIKGGFKSSTNSFVPTGDMNFTIKDYDVILDYLISRKAFEKKDVMRALLQKISGANDTDADLHFAIKRVENGELKIGNLSIADLFSFYYQK